MGICISNGHQSGTLIIDDLKIIGQSDSENQVGFLGIHNRIFGRGCSIESASIVKIGG